MSNIINLGLWLLSKNLTVSMQTTAQNETGQLTSASEPSSVTQEYN